MSFRPSVCICPGTAGPGPSAPANGTCTAGLAGLGKRTLHHCQHQPMEHGDERVISRGMAPARKSVQKWWRKRVEK